MRKNPFSLKSLPGLLLALLGLALNALDWAGRLQLVLEVVQGLGGSPAMIASIIQHPAFGISLIIVGLAYVIFVGEPNRGVIRQPWLPYVGWTVLALAAATVSTILVIGFWNVSVREGIEARLSQEVDTRLQQHLSPWKMSDEQKEKFIEILRTRENRFPVKIDALSGSSHSQSFALSLSSAFIDDGWPLRRSVSNGLRPDLVGLYIFFPIGVDFKKEMPERALFISDALASVGYHVQYLYGDARIGMPGVDNNTFWIVVGNRPIN